MAEIDSNVLRIHKEICGLLMTSDMRSQEVARQLTEKSVELTGAQFGAYFKNTPILGEDSWSLHASHGLCSHAIPAINRVRATTLLAATFGEGLIVRIPDVREDPRYGSSGGMPTGHFSVRSYLAVPILEVSGTIRGGLLLGHSDPGVFTERTEQVVSDTSSLCSLALEAAAQREHEQLLLAELNHRVKNTLATVQSIAVQTMRYTDNHDAFSEAFVGRLQSLSSAHDLLTCSSWHGAHLKDVLTKELGAFLPSGCGRWTVRGPKLMLQPAAVNAIAMVIHELTTNAVKYGALSPAGGHVTVTWGICDSGKALDFRWTESDGPPVTEPTRKGFGSRLLVSIARQFSAKMSADYHSDGFVFAAKFPLENIIPSAVTELFNINKRIT
jgi:two-component sensor histidine kinase